MGSKGKIGRTSATSGGLFRTASNVGLALLFFAALLPGATHYSWSAANIVWTMGAVLMGVFSLVRVPPSAATVNVSSIAATAVIILIPALLRPGAGPAGLVSDCGAGIEFAGVFLTQTARVYMGRSFGLLPANRGIVRKGPFRLVRHPVYLGWLILTLGYAIVYPSGRNALIALAVLPFLAWRILQEEQLLGCDAAYRDYCEEVRSRLIPGML
jgi:protein-S-isoprenylcysteine O-methyltransferase Ste14